MALSTPPRVICQSMDADLAEIESEEESGAVLGHLYDTIAAEGVFYNDIW